MSEFSLLKQWRQASIRNRCRDLDHFSDNVASIDPMFQKNGVERHFLVPALTLLL